MLKKVQSEKNKERKCKWSLWPEMNKLLGMKIANYVSKSNS